MRLSRSLLILWTLSGALAVSGCDSFTLIGSVNLGSGPEQPIQEPDAHGVKDDAANDGPTSLCIPKRPKASDGEFAAHRYITGHEPEWKATRAWFEKIGKLPTCP